LFLVGVRLWYLLPTCFFGVSLFSLAVYLDPVRLRRITSFLDVEANRSDSSYQLWQSILAFGAGGTSGVGLGNGRQQLSYLPEAHTDFILPVIGEELGLWTTLTIAMLFLVLFLCVLLCIRKAPDLFQFTLMMGAVLFITFQALINMGVVTGLLPTKGISLPFISYGGSNLVVMFIMCGIILNCLRVGAASPLLRPREL
jgi:cell division protein FtsW